MFSLALSNQLVCYNSETIWLWNNWIRDHLCTEMPVNKKGNTLKNLSCSYQNILSYFHIYYSLNVKLKSKLLHIDLFTIKHWISWTIINVTMQITQFQQGILSLRNNVITPTDQKKFVMFVSCIKIKC